jgi:hypothetical protein
MTRVQGSVQLIDQPQKEEEVNEDGEWNRFYRVHDQI